MTESERRDAEQELEDLRAKHRELDQLISLLMQCVAVDQISLRRMKKRKLQLKDAIARIEDDLIPDLDA